MDEIPERKPDVGNGCRWKDKKLLAEKVTDAVLSRQHETG